jgi:hypothetical protein
MLFSCDTFTRVASRKFNNRLLCRSINSLTGPMSLGVRHTSDHGPCTATRQRVGCPLPDTLLLQPLPPADSAEARPKSVCPAGAIQVFVVALHLLCEPNSELHSSAAAVETATGDHESSVRRAANHRRSMQP